MRFVLDLYPGPDGIHGQVTLEDRNSAESFSGWLELIRLLEPPPAQGESRPEPPRDLVEPVRQLVEAENHRDRNTADRVLSESCVGVTRAGGIEQTREEFLDELASPRDLRLHRELDVVGAWSRRYPIFGVVRSIVTTRDRSRIDHAVKGRFRNLHVLVLEDERWRCLAWQVTRLAP
ncbi:nuclear transport factor 2 family protein [Actinomadura sp. SCN-SB]|uniref:nuclear transport factor 2 family protein n=1 Tax=Actinomadura sp. SCN-SB TaxID=3373092 RepID=UPI00375176A8